MFTQFFGSYLLNQKYVSPEQLAEAIELQKTVRLKLGVLAIHAGYMTAEQVEEVHSMQAQVDKRIGDIAVDMGFMTRNQVEELLQSQKIGYLLLGQALVDKGYMTNAQFEEAINTYKAENQIEEIDPICMEKDQLHALVKKFYQLDVATDAALYTEYIGLLFRNIVRFIGDDFTPMEIKVVQSYPANWLATQKLVGDFEATIGIGGSEQGFAGLAARFAEEELGENSELIQASVGEFLNLQNGLFCVNLSNEKDMELDLEPQQVMSTTEVRYTEDAYLLPICFPFGTIDFIIAR